MSCSKTVNVFQTMLLQTMQKLVEIDKETYERTLEIREMKNALARKNLSAKREMILAHGVLLGIYFP